MLAAVVKGMVEFLSNDFSINAEIFENASRSRMRNNRILQKSQAMRSQLFVIPRFSMSLVHNRKITANKMDSVHSILSNRLRKGVYSHHDVYLYPSQGKSHTLA